MIIFLYNISTVLKAFKYRIYPNQKQAEMLNEHFGATRFVYNWGLEKKTEAYQQEAKTVSCYDLINQLVALKTDNPWLKTVNSQSLQSALKNLDNAYTKFFREKKGFPKFKSRHNPKQSFQCPQHCSVDWESGTLSIPKVKRIKAKLHRKFNGEIKTVTISKNTVGRYYVSILVENNERLPPKAALKAEDAVGIDVGLSRFITTSDGMIVENPRCFKKSEKRLAYEQYRLSKMKKGSAGRAKQKKRIARSHEHISNQRRDFLHKVTAKLVGESQATTFCIEDLSIKNMQKNHCLAKSIADVSWGMFFDFLKYKCEWNGKNLLDIGRFEPSSKMCSACGTVNKELKLSNREWLCSCGAQHDRDINAAENIRRMAFQRQNLIRCIGLEQPESTPLDTVAIAM
jgi:putative transposase